MYFVKKKEPGYVLPEKVLTRQRPIAPEKTMCYKTGCGQWRRILWHTYAGPCVVICRCEVLAVPPYCSWSTLTQHLHNACRRSIQTTHFIKWWNTKKWLSHRWSLSLAQFSATALHVHLPTVNWVHLTDNNPSLGHVLVDLCFRYIIIRFSSRSNINVNFKLITVLCLYVRQL